MANIKIRNRNYYEEINQMLDECTRKNNVSPEEYKKITELMSEKISVNVKEKLSYRSDVEVIANQFKDFMSDYLKQAKEKGFFKTDTIIANLRTLNSINRIGDRPQSTYGSAGVGAGNLDFAFDNVEMQNPAFRKEIFFHEVTHHLINKNICMDFISLTGRIKLQELQELEHELGIPLKSATNFIAEFLTEEMAQQLFCDRRPAKTKVGVGEANLESNYTPEFNRRYQTLGTEFIKTLQECSDLNEENMLKKMLLLALDDKVDLINIIRNNYQGKEIELKTIFSSFSKVINRTHKITYDEVENFFRIAEKNYTLDYSRPTFDRKIPVSIKAKTSSRIRIHTDKPKETTNHFKIKSSSDSNKLGNEIIDELLDVEYTDKVQQQIDNQEKQLSEDNKQK